MLSDSAQADSSADCCGEAPAVRADEPRQRQYLHAGDVRYPAKRPPPVLSDSPLVDQWQKGILGVPRTNAEEIRTAESASYGQTDKFLENSVALTCARSAGGILPEREGLDGTFSQRMTASTLTFLPFGALGIRLPSTGTPSTLIFTSGPVLCRGFRTSMW